MRGLGDFQRRQMRDADPRVGDFFNRVREAIDVLEQIMLRPYHPASTELAKEEVRTEIKTKLTPAAPEDQRVSYTIKEVRKLVGISNTTLYRAIGNRELRAVKFGHKTLILAKDLHTWLEALPAAR